MNHSAVSRDITLRYFFSRNFIWFGQKEPIKVQNFRFWTAHMKFHQICTLIGSFCWKYTKFHLKKYRGFMSHYTEDWCKFRRKTDLLSQKWQELVNFDLSNRDSQTFYVDWLLLYKVYNVWPKKVPSGYLSWHGRVMTNFKKNWLMVWKMTWKIWQIFTRALEKLQNWDFDRILSFKVENVWV